MGWATRPIPLGLGILPGESSLNWPLGPSPTDILRQVLSGNYSAFGVPTLGELMNNAWVMDAGSANNPFARNAKVEQSVQQCVSGWQNSTAGKVAAYGSLLSFVDNFWEATKSWTEIIATKGAYFKVMEIAGQSVTPAGETTYITTAVKPAVGKLGTLGLTLATTGDLTARAGCRIANDPRAMTAYTLNP